MPRDGAGNPVHSFGRGKLNDDMRKDKTMQHQTRVVDPKSRPAGHQPDPDAEMKDESPEDIHDVVAEHGPAKHIHMQHDHEAGVHQVTSYHGEHEPGKEEGEGFTHHSKHGSHHEAHKHAGHALGMSEGDEKESPEYESAEEGKMSNPIPGMA
jgi:hypothetical protein